MVCASAHLRWQGAIEKVGGVHPGDDRLASFEGGAELGFRRLRAGGFLYRDPETEPFGGFSKVGLVVGPKVPASEEEARDPRVLIEECEYPRTDPSRQQKEQRLGALDAGVAEQNPEGGGGGDSAGEMRGQVAAGDGRREEPTCL
jgi:hypothetical protein